MNNSAKIEEKILAFWEKNKIFEKSIKKRKNSPVFSFYDGPPFATGKPHYGHVLATTIKDSVLRYWTMKGYQVPRRVGWDCHGLPIENLIEKELGIKSKRDIESMGIEKFNKACRSVVFRGVKDFEVVLKRVGRWADYKDSYATLENDYIESVWWVFSRLWEAGLVYEEYKVTPYCPRCGTPVSNFEVNQGYKDVKDNSVYLKFKVKNDNSFFLVWTTTPWTLPGNVALAVNPNSKYVQIEKDKELLILAKDRLSVIGDHKIIKEISGKDLIGTEYESLYPFLEKETKESKHAFRILPGSFVSMDEGTGIVHTAVMYGEDDFKLGKRFNLPMVHTVDQSGVFVKDTGKFSGRFVKDAEDDIIADLKERGLIYSAKKEEHNYPFCWRCDTPLLYYALKTWYIKVSELKKELVSNNKKIRWVPAHIKEGRFGKWLKGAKDWSFSRNRFWGAPIPIWRCEKCSETKCIDSIKKLPKKLKDLHRPYIDKVKLTCQCGGKMTRIEEVFDCWFESGSMPYASYHYPFKNKKTVEERFPADFIAEGLDQTRGWFYTLHVLATALTLEGGNLGKNKPAFKNAIVNGLILDSEGRKLSKKLKNYPETSEVFDRYGADSLRYFLLSSTPIGEDYLFSAKGVEDVWRKIISTLLNSYIFFETHLEPNFIPKKRFKVSDELNRWILSRINATNKEVVEQMDNYELTKATRPFELLVDDLSNWYIRRSRRKFQKPNNQKEKEEASQTLFRALMDISKMMAPFTPFIAEHIYLQLIKLNNDKSEESIHLCDYPKSDNSKIDSLLEKRMGAVRTINSLALAQRSKAGMKVRQPLSLLQIKKGILKKNDILIELIKDEVNVKKVEISSEIADDVLLDTNLTDELIEEGFMRELVRRVQDSRKTAKLTKKDKIRVQISGTEKIETLVKEWQDFFLFESGALGVDFVKVLNEKDSNQIEFKSEKALISIEKVK